MPSLSDTIKPTGLKLLQYGPSGSGKSVRAAMFAQFGPTYFFDFDQKMENLRLYLTKKHPDLLKKIEYDVYRGQDATIVDRVFAKLKTVEGKYATVVFDSWTYWERAFVDHLMAKFQGFGGKGWGEARTVVNVTTEQKVTIPGTADHQLKNRAVHEFIDQLTSLPLNIVVNCHMKEVMKGPATVECSGGIANTLPKYFNEWHYLYAQTGGFYKVRVKPNDDFLANSARTDVGPSGILEKDDLTVYDSQLVKL